MWVSIIWLIVAGPVGGLLLAGTKGAPAWRSALGWVAACQAIAVVLYVVLQPMPVRSFGTVPTERDIRTAKALFAVGVYIAGVILAMIVTAIWRAFTHGQ